jgi:hypothetical protein
VRTDEETDMPKYLLLMSYGGTDCAPMPEWTPAEVKAHIDFQRALGSELTAKGELLDAQGLGGPDVAKIVVSDGRSAPVVSDGPFPETKEFLAGYWLVDVDSEDRAIEIAAKASAAPGPGGNPIKQPIEVHPVFDAPAVEG